MRELKFRVWNNFEKTYEDGERYYLAKNGTIVVQDGYTMAQLAHPPTVEQYTGLKDKDGKEIYEGDIVDYNDDGDCIGYVVYNAPHYEIMEKIGYPCWLKGGPHQRVIGNIHENPELLEKKE